MEGNSIIFESKTDLIQMKLDETGSFIIDEINYPNNNKIDLSKDLFKNENTLILKAKDIKEFKLNKKDGSSLTLKKGEAPFIAIWSDKVFGNYVCIEPWFGVPDFMDPIREISNKKYIEKIKPNSSFEYSYSIKINW